MNRFVSEKLPLSGLKILQRQKMNDERGFFCRIFCADELAESGWHKPIAQINHSYTRKKGVVRGLHFQRDPFMEMKLVSVVRGELWDVAIDFREDSKTYLKWHAEVLSAENNRAMLIPEGFAHGYQSLTDEVEILYCHSVAYNREAECGLNPTDAKLGIKWPLAISDLSEKDRNYPLIDEDFYGCSIK
jgi:dTDP-4-dehydrorhamnose 3,5-epimerase